MRPSPPDERHLLAGRIADWNRELSRYLNYAPSARIDLSHKDFSKKPLSGVNFTNCDLDRALLVKAVLVDIDCTNAGLRGLNFNQAKKVSFKSLQGADLNGSTLPKHLIPQEPKGWDLKPWLLIFLFTLCGLTVLTYFGDERHLNSSTEMFQTIGLFIPFRLAPYLVPFGIILFQLIVCEKMLGHINMHLTGPAIDQHGRRIDSKAGVLYLVAHPAFLFPTLSHKAFGSTQRVLGGLFIWWLPPTLSLMNTLYLMRLQHLPTTLFYAALTLVAALISLTKNAKIRRAVNPFAHIRSRLMYVVALLYVIMTWLGLPYLKADVFYRQGFVRNYLDVGGIEISSIKKDATWDTDYATVSKNLVRKINVAHKKLRFLAAVNSKWVGAEVEGTDFRHAKFRNADLRGLNKSPYKYADPDSPPPISPMPRATNFSHADLTKADMRYAEVPGSDFSNATFNETQLDSAIFNGSTFQHMQDFSPSFGLRPPPLKDTDWQESKLDQFVFNRIPMQGSSFECVTADWASFNHADLHRANFNHSHLNQCGFTTTVLTRAFFHHARIENLDFDGGTILRSAEFHHTHLVDVGFIKVDLARTSFRGALLDGCRFSGGNLAGADFTGAVFHNVSFDNVDLRSTSGLTEDAMAHAVIGEKVMLPNLTFQATIPSRGTN